VYQILLTTYPVKFQKEYGSDMLQVFRDSCVRTIRQSGANGMLNLWAVTLLDFLRSVFEQHLQKEAYMSKSQFIKLSGWAFIVGSFAFIAILSNSGPLSIPGSVISSILLSVGLLGLRARYGERVGGFGRYSLLLGVSGPFVLVIFIAMSLAGILTATQVGDGFWILPYAGPAITLLGLTLFGFAALQHKVMSGRGWLPVVAGIWYPSIYFFVADYVFTRHDVEALLNPHWSLIEIMFLIQFGALCLLGAVLNDDVSEEMATPV
jgi:hypothetical protein